MAAGGAKQIPGLNLLSTRGAECILDGCAAPRTKALTCLDGRIAIFTFKSALLSSAPSTDQLFELLFLFFLGLHVLSCFRHKLGTQRLIVFFAHFPGPEVEIK